MLFEKLVVRLSESQRQVRQRLELVRFNDTERSISSTNARVENSNEFRLGSGHHGGSCAAGRVVNHVLLAEGKKLDKVVGEGLEVDMQLLLRLQCVEILLGAAKLVEE